METELESSAEIDEFILGWKNPKFQLPSIFNEMLKQKELIDVTLSAEGRLFGAHRLVLSAFSPYFRQLLTPIPIDQKAYGENIEINFNLTFFLSLTKIKLLLFIVVLDNVSSSILEDLITFMYCGEVYVRRENLGELLKTGQLLKIKGLADVKYSYNESKTMPDKGSQLKSRTKIETNDPMEVPTTSADISKIEEPKTSPLSDFSGNSNDLKSKFFEINNNIRDGVGNDISNANAQSMVRRLHNKHWQAKRTMTAIHDPRLVTDSGPPKKLLKFTNGKWICLQCFTCAL